MGRQYFDEITIDPPVANQTTVAATSITQLWDAANLTALGANQVRAGQVWEVVAFGIATSPASAQTVIFTPIFGTVVGGTSLGASVAGSTIASKTNVPWFARFNVIFRTLGTSGTAVCGGNVTSEVFNGVAAGTAVGASITYGGGNPTTVNTTVAAGLLLAVTPNIATLTFTCQGVAMRSLN